MSLINEMLRDLEARRAGELARSDLQREIRALPERRQDRTSHTVLWAVVALLALAVAGLLLWRAEMTRPGENVAPAPLPSPQPVAPVQQPVLPPPAVAVESPPAEASEALQLAKALENPPGGKLPPQPIDAAPAKPEPPPAKPEAAPPKPKAAEEPKAGQGSIEKTVVLGTPREKADAEFRRAQALLAGGQVAAAHDALRGALKQDPTYIPARQSLLRILLESRHVDEALAILQEGLDLLPAQVGWAMSMARLLVERGDVAGAERVLSRSAAYATGNAEYAGFHGHLLDRLGQHRSASEQYQAACRLAPGDGRWWFGLGQALEGDGRSQEAREAFRRALATGNLNADLAALAEQKTR